MSFIMPSEMIDYIYSCTPRYQVFSFTTMTGTLDNLLQRVDEIKEGRVKEVLRLLTVAAS